MCADAADEETIGDFMERYRPAKNPRKQRAQRSQWNQTAVVFDQELSAQIGIAILNASAGLVDLELGLNVVLVQPPARSVHLSGDLAERFQQFEQTHVIAALPLHNRQRVIRSDGVNG